MCGDSDGGLALTVYGQTKGANIGFGTWINDSCKDSRTLYEGFCSGSYVNRTEVACPSFAPFCTNGQCVASCTDSDGGNVTYVKGSIVGVNAGFGTSAADSCASVGTLYEYYCDGTALKRYSFTCAGRIPACSDGRCVACADTDSGLNYVVQGTTKGGLGAFGNYVTDSCKDSKTLYEYYCGGGSYVNRTEVACPVATPNCLNGICKA
jgi:hypothetical protein